VAEESEDATVRGSVRGCMGFAPGAPRRGGVSFAKRRAARPLRIVSRLVGACGLCGWSAFGTLRTVAYPAARTPASTWFSAAKGEPRTANPLSRALRSPRHRGGHPALRRRADAAPGGAPPSASSASTWFRPSGPKSRAQRWC